MTLLDVRDLRTNFRTDDGVVRAVDGVTLSVDRNQTLGIVGESGCGKTVTALTIMGLNNPRNASSEGIALFDGEDLLKASPKRMREIRGAKIAMIFQDPMTSLNPVKTIGWQLVEAIMLHHNVSRKDARARAMTALREVEIPRADKRIDDYPHQFSGGMRQRVMIAMALINGPDLLIADEPTTALDVTTQAQILDLLRRLQADHNTAIVMITHDLGVVAEIADDVVVMYAGRVIEQATVGRLFGAPRHPYTWGLLGSRPRIDVETPRLVQISGQPPSLLNPPEGCRFHPRCVYRMDICTTEVPALTASPQTPDHQDACFLDDGSKAREPEAPAVRSAITTASAVEIACHSTAHELLVVENLTKYFPLDGRGHGSEPASVKAVDGVSFVLRQGETLGVVGESGCGKSTMARCIARLLTPTDGTVTFDGLDITHFSRSEMRPVRREMMMVFQDPYASLNARKRVGFIVREPLEVHGIGTDAQQKRRAQDLLEIVGLNPEHYNRFPHEFSGGQRQRIGVARALALNPKLIICDEPVSALDVSVQAQILNLLKDLQGEFGLTYLFIAHDLNVVRHISDRVMVMYLGKVAEVGEGRALYDRPKHPYTGALLSAVPVPDPELRGEGRSIVLKGDVPNPISPPSACRFHPRCPRFVAGTCDVEEPTLHPFGDQHDAACHFPLERWPMTADEIALPSPTSAARS